MKIVILGLGALGTVFAAFLEKGGHTVYAIIKEKYLKDYENRKVRVTGIWGEHWSVLDGIYSSVEPLKHEDIDLIFLAVKSYDTEKAAKQIKPLVKEKTFVVVLQNGYGNYEIVSKEIGREHTLLARVIFGSKVIETGYAEVTVIADDVRLGQPDNAIPEDKIIEIASEINSAGIPTFYAKNVYQLLWDKILYNCALNPLGAILECNYGQLAEHEETREIMTTIIKEIFVVAKANNIKLNWRTYEEYLDHFYDNLVPPTSKHFPSMYHDIKAGKKLEIDALNGAVVKLARRRNISVPVNETITYLIKTKESLSSHKTSVSI